MTEIRDELRGALEAFMRQQSSDSVRAGSRGTDATASTAVAGTCEHQVGELSCIGACQEWWGKSLL